MSSTSTKDEMARQILNVTEELIAEIGIHQLTMRKIAEKAQMALGTLYLYFKTKDELLSTLVHDLYDRYHQYLLQNYDEKAPLEARYYQLFNNKLKFLQDYPTTAKNFVQYQAINEFETMVLESINDQDFVWNKFLREGQDQGVIANLPQELLYNFSIGMAGEIVYMQQVTQQVYSQDVVAKIRERSWKAILR